MWKYPIFLLIAGLLISPIVLYRFFATSKKVPDELRLKSGPKVPAWVYWVLVGGAVAGVLYASIYAINNPDPEVKNSVTKEEAIEAAKNYKNGPNELCTGALVPAVHEQTGAKYTFPSGCLAPGWQAE